MSHQIKSLKEDRISGLPEPVIHHIMSLLPWEDVTRTGSLSKTWHSLWSTYPNLEFDQTILERTWPETLSNYEKWNLLLMSVNQSLQRLEERSVSIHRFKLHATIEDQNLFRFAVERALRSNVREIDLAHYDMENQHYKYKMPQCLYSAKEVKRLKLTGLEVGQIVDLLSGCPSMEEFDLEWCKTFKDVKFSSDKLLKFHVQLQLRDGLNNIELDACNLQSFGYHGYSINYNDVIQSLSERIRIRNCTISLSTCIFLKNLSLKKAKISDQWLELHISTLVHLEDLCLEQCIGLARVRICHKKLKRMHLLLCDVKEAHIDCPKLSRFLFEGAVPRVALFNSSGSLVATLTILKGTTAWWFSQFQRLLSFFNHCKTLEIVCDSYKELVFPEEVRESCIPPMPDLQHLEINFRSSTVDYAELLDNLLWLSPHLKMVSLTSKFEKQRLKFQYKKISQEKGEEILFNCCKAYPRECWRHCLERVMLDNIDGSADEDDGQISLFSFFYENAKGLVSIQDNSGTYEWREVDTEGVL